MHADERLRALLAATGCTVCGGTLEADRIRILAERDDLAFAELPCARCGSATLAMVTGASSAEPSVDVSGPGELTAAEEARFAGRPPVDERDVSAIRELLRDHRGDLRSLLAGSASDDAGGAAGVGP
jgi:hypothetical protein